MTLNETFQKINNLQHLIGEKVPGWNSPIIEIIPAPANSEFIDYIELYEKTSDLKKAIQIAKSKQFDVLLIFRTPQLHGGLVYEWHSFFY